MENLLPAPGKLIVQRDKEENVTEGGIVLPNIETDTVKLCVVGVDDLEKLEVRAGDCVYVHGDVFEVPNVIQVGEEHVYVVFEEDVLAVERHE